MPDFIICGAMKCGTSTVHCLLDLHPKIFIPKSEVNFFDIDDILQHSDFFFRLKKKWCVPDITNDPNLYWDWYSNFFAEAPKNSIIGEDSTCYLSSWNAPMRISLQKKRIKVIICLRHPTKRAYSQYWHMLRTGRAIFNFEDTLRYNPHSVLDRSMYLNQIENLLMYINKKHVFFFILEEYLSDKKRISRKLFEFLNVSFDKLPATAFDIHSNKGIIPKNTNLQILKNKILRGYGNTMYRGKLPYNVPSAKISSKITNLLNKLHNKINPIIDNKIPEMAPETKRFLDKLFERELDGINELIGSNVIDLWFHKRKRYYGKIINE
ncbi:MAG: sulfotransferase domain-containing protein [Deltaproteobacteria bacterium]|jgi:hypothetical protein|nr:sulfotransferase domain-containing protein [Deltaproteobacteria bacterium]